MFVYEILNLFVFIAVFILLKFILRGFHNISVTVNLLFKLKSLFIR